MLYSKPELLALAVDLSPTPPLTCAIIHTLSQWMPATVNHSPEAGLQYEQGSADLYGLMQFSALQARQAGFTAEFNALLEPEINIRIGNKVLNSYHGNSQLLMYLGRSRAEFIPQITALCKHYEELITSRPS